MKKLLLIPFLALLLVSCSEEPTKNVFYPKYSWSKCYDNDSSTFSQEYMDNDTQKMFDAAEEKYGGCRYTRQGHGSIIGCTGDLFNSFSCWGEIGK